MGYEDMQYMENNGDNANGRDSSDDDGYDACWMQWLIHFFMLLTIF